MEHENWRERLDEHLLARLAARRTKLNRCQVRDAFECVFYSVNRIVLLEVSMSVPKICVGEMGRGITDLDVELERSPAFNGDSVGLV
jgi:hypothetical protein